MKHQGYYTRALKANDPRYARVFEKMGYGRSDMTDTGDAVPSASEGGDDGEDATLKALRDEYQEVVGKKPYHGWDAATLGEKILAHKAA